MCIIVSKPAGVVLDADVYKNCFVANHDGAGFSYVKDNKVHVEKGFFDAASLLAALEPHKEEGLVVHFRWATHGEKNEFNCHPWLIDGCFKDYSFAVSHNGVLAWASSEEMSDTGHFVQDILAPLLRRDPWFLEHSYGVTLIENMIGKGNKLAIQRSDGRVFLLNEKAWVGDLGCWFSNLGYKSTTRTFSSYWDDEEEEIPALAELTDDEFAEHLSRDNEIYELACEYAELHKRRIPRGMTEAREMLRCAYRRMFPETTLGLNNDQLDDEILENSHTLVS